MQLKMLWNCKETRYPENHHPLFHYRRFTASDADINQWLSICKHGLIGEDAGYETYEQLLKNWKDYSPQDTFLIEQGGVPAATVTAIVHPFGRYAAFVGRQRIVRVQQNSPHPKRTQLVRPQIGDMSFSQVRAKQWHGMLPP